MERFLEKKLKRYVAATLDTPTLYLKKVVGKEEYYFVEDIELATKTNTEILMDEVLRYFRYDTGLDIELVVVPVEISYEIIMEDV